MRLKKSLGQHFLKDRKVVKRIVEEGKIESKDNVLEIGAGGGALTEEILKKNPSQVVLLEIDRDWVEFLKNKFGEKVKVIQADATKFNFSELKGKWKFFGNLPYNVSTAILRNVLTHRKVMKLGIFMVQREVAERLTALKGKKYGYFPALLHLFFKIERLFDVHPKSFVPPPRVFSSVIKVVPKDFEMEERELLEFENFLKKVFSHRRKKLKNKIELPEKFKAYGEKRAEEISPFELLEIFRALKKRKIS